VRSTGARASTQQERPTYAFGAHLAVVDVDTETGEVTLRRHVAVDDAGRVINVPIAEGQRHGGIAHGAGQALSEETNAATSGADHGHRQASTEARL
jgi:aerobic carbon-monoxide dehydrogenase large subunit